VGKRCLHTGTGQIFNQTASLFVPETKEIRGKKRINKKERIKENERKKRKEK
jgi:hypothetical protein